MFAKIPWLSIGRFALILLCLIIVLAVVVTILPIYLDVTFFRGPVEELLSDFAEAPVTVGEVRLHPSPWPTLRLSDAEVAGSGQADSPLFSRIDEVEIQLSLPSLLRKQLRIQRFLVSGATFHAHRSEGRSGNWPVWTKSSIQIEELAGIEFDNVTLNLEDHKTVQATLVVDRLTCDIAKDRALDLRLEGSLQGLPLSVTAAGPTLAAPLSRASDFPLSLDLSLSDLQLEIEGSGSREPGGTRFQSTFAVDSEDLAILRELGQIDVPEIGGLQISGQLSLQPSVFAISELAGSAGSTTVHGRLTLDLADERPLLSGRLSLGQLNLEPWLEASDESPSDPASTLPLSLLSTANASVELRLKELTGLPVTVEDLSLEVELEGEQLSVPATALVAEIPLSAQLRIDANQDDPNLSARLSARDLTAQQLSRIVEIPAGLDGQLGTLDLGFASSGQTLDAVVNNLLVQADVADTTLAFMDETGEDRLEIFFNQVQATQRHGSPLTATARGTILDDRFTLNLQTAPLSQLVESDRWPLTASLEGAGATVGIDGFLEQVATGPGFEFEFNISGDRIGSLENWLGFPSHADHSYNLQGRLSSAAGKSKVRLDPSSLGRTLFAGDLAWSTDDEDQPFMVNLHAEALDLRELQHLSDSVTHMDTEQDVMGIDLPVLPSRRNFHDAEIELQVDRLFRDPIDITQIAATLHIKEGRLERSPFSFAYGTHQFAGELSLDLRQETPHFTLEFHGDGKNLGEILEKEEIVEGFGVVAEELDVRIDASGASVREIIRSADLSGQLVDVRWTIQPAEFDEPLKVGLDRLDLSGPKGKPIVLTASGTLDQEPLDLRLTLRLPKDPREVPEQALLFALALRLAGTDIELNGEVELPITKRDFGMTMTVQGQTAATLSSLLDFDLPDLGPYHLNGSLSVAEGSLSLEDLDFVVGESDVRGEISYRRIDERPTLSADLTSRLIRTEDFLELGSEDDDEEQTFENPEFQKAPTSLNLKLDKLHGIDLAIDIAAREILTVGGTIESLIADLDLQRGSLDLSLKRPQEDAEDAELTARIRPWGEGVEAEVRASWDRQPYGLVADMLSPGSAKGSWGVDLDLESRGASLPELAANLSGYLNFADYPEDMDATIFDLWGGGLIKSLLPVFQLGSESRVNCTVARFLVDEGVLTPESLIIDSTRTRVKGKGSIDLPGDKIDLRLRPRPKQRNLINLSTPVKIHGPLTDPDVNIAAGGMAVTFFRLSLWVYTVWRDIVRKPLPGDGHDVCVDPFAAPKKQ